MFEAFSRLLRESRLRPWISRDTRLLRDWARERGALYKVPRQGHGCVIENCSRHFPARLEWGDSQRDYIRGAELRLRLEPGLPESFEVLVMTRTLAERLEQQAFKQLTRGTQTGIDATMPEEARWLAMFEPITLDDAEFGHHFVLLAASRSAARAWVEGDLAARLLRARDKWLGADTAFVMMALRGRLLLRCEARNLDESVLDGLCLVAENAASHAQQAARRGGRVDPATPRRGVVGNALGVTHLRSLDEPLPTGEVTAMVPDPGPLSNLMTPTELGDATGMVTGDTPGREPDRPGQKTRR
ncbi:hypothetical protein [Leptothrix discophora]|uniref:Uncharacterized protein n=1 Tax=Leptothrix discophora TaxID=89 RepID=A0ABT9G214_LEPDI|nr:hypothetical protein [Leptothrix discophora]MDP4300529.1 hypothetical protein [Leptothrix discophora]